MKKIVSLALALVMLALCLSAVFPLGAAAATTDRTGWTAISSASDFAAIKSGTEGAVKKYYLTKDISINATIGGSWSGGAMRYIELDGQGNTITLSKSLFNFLDEAYIHDINFTGKIVWTTATFQKSPLTAGMYSASNSVPGKVRIENVNSDVDMEVSFNNRYKRLSGIVHYTGSGSTLTNVKYTGSITVKPTAAGDAKIEDVGGLVGTAKGTTFTDCTNEANIIIKAGVTPGIDGKNYEGPPLCGTAAGIAGETSSCSFINCSNSGDITIENCGYYTAGGIAGAVSGATVMTNCTNTGDISLQACTNGLVGCNPYRIQQSGCSTTGKITQSLVKVNKVNGSCNEMSLKEHYTCIACGAYYDANYKKVSISDILGDYEHDLGELIPEKKATCLESGMRAHYRCADCNSYFDEQGEETLEFFLVTEAGHTLAKVPKGDATCFYPKVLVEHYFCIVCEGYFDTDMSPIDEADAIEGEALGHNYGELIAEKPASVGVAGTKAHYECSGCHTLFDTDKNEVESDELTIPALEPTPEPEDPEKNEPEDDKTEDDKTEDDKTEDDKTEDDKSEESKPDEETTDTTESETEAPSGALPVDKEENDGCSSSLTGMSAVAVLALIGSAAATIRKKED